MTNIKKKIIIGLAILGATGAILIAGMPDKTFENLPNVERIPTQALYRIKFDEWSEVEIPEKDMPEAVLKKWGDETFIKISYPDFHPVNPKQHQGKLKWVNSDKEVHLYPLEPRTITENGHTFKQLEQGGFEFEIIEKKKTAPEIALDLELHNVVGYRQPPLTEEFKNGWSEEFQKEIVVTETTVKDLEGNILVHRPENVVDSIVFYHATKGNMHAGEEEAEKYKTSQIGFLYRSKSIDSNGWEVWNKQEIKDGKLIITRSQDFIDNAVCPIKHSAGATFGYTTAGGSQTAGTTSDRRARKGNPGEDGTATKISAHLAHSGTNKKWDSALYKDSDNSREAEGSEETVTSSTAQWWDSTISAGISNQIYKCAVIYDDGIKISYNTGGVSGDAEYELNVGYSNGLPDPWDGTNSSYFYSIYCTYTPAGATRRTMDIE